MTVHIKHALIGATAAFAMMIGGSATAGEWKPKKITVVVPHSLGGGQERLTRAFISVWAKHMKTEFKILPKRGSSGRVGFDYFQEQKDALEGTVIIATNLATTGMMWIQQKPPWDWNSTIKPLGLFGVDPGVYAVRSDSKFKTLKDVIAATRKKPLTISVTQWSSSENLNIHQLMGQLGIKLQSIPSGGGAKTLTAVLGGHVDLGMTKVSNFKKGGDKIRYLAISQSHNMLPTLIGDVPTVDKALGTKTTHVASYRTMVVSKKFADKYPERFEQLRKTLEQAKDDPEYIAKAKKVGIHPNLIVDMSPDGIQGIIEGYWDAFEKYKGTGVFKKKKKKKK